MNDQARAMSPAEFVLLYEACGLDYRTGARYLLRSGRMIQSYINGAAAIPYDVATRLRLLDAELDRGALELRHQVRPGQALAIGVLGPQTAIRRAMINRARVLGLVPQGQKFEFSDGAPLTADPPIRG